VENVPCYKTLNIFFHKHKGVVMDIEYKGGNCIEITYKKSVFVTDPGIGLIGLKDQGQKATTILLTQKSFGVKPGEETLVVDGPGDYEIQNCSLKGIAAYRHVDETTGYKNATIYRLEADDIRVAILGHISPKLTDEQMEEIGVVDVLILPVGNHGYTLDAKSAVDLVRAIEPKIVIPTHYAEAGINYEVPQASVEDFVTELGATNETLSKLKLKPNQLPLQLTVYVIGRSK
jgi:hypothetical protein